MDINEKETTEEDSRQKKFVAETTMKYVHYFLGNPESNTYLSRRYAFFMWRQHLREKQLKDIPGLLTDEPNKTGLAGTIAGFFGYITNPRPQEPALLESQGREVTLKNIQFFLDNHDTKAIASSAISPFIKAYWDGMSTDVKREIARYLPAKALSRLIRTSQANKKLLAPFLDRPLFAHCILKLDIERARRLLAKNPMVLRSSRVFIREETPALVLALHGPVLEGGEALFNDLCNRYAHQYVNNDPILSKLSDADKANKMRELNEASTLMYPIIHGLEPEPLQVENYVRKLLLTHPNLIFTPLPWFNGLSPLQQALADFDIYRVEDLLRPHLRDPKITAGLQQKAAQQHEALIEAHQQAKDTWDDPKKWEEELLRLKHGRWIARTSIFMQGLTPEIYKKVRENIKAIKPSWFYDRILIMRLSSRVINTIKPKSFNEYHEGVMAFHTLRLHIRKFMPRGSVTDCLFFSYYTEDDPPPNFYEDGLPRTMRLHNTYFYDRAFFTSLGLSYLVHPYPSRDGSTDGVRLREAVAFISHFVVRGRQVDWFMKNLPLLAIDLEHDPASSPTQNPFAA